MITAAALCPAPPLLARELTGGDPVLPELREACLAAVRALQRTRPEVIAIVGPAEQTGVWDSSSRLDLGIYAPAVGGGGTAGLPPSLGLGVMLLDQAGYNGRRLLQAAGDEEPASGCDGIGAELARLPERTALLVMADGSARRSRRAPGALDERSAGFDAGVEQAIRSGDMAALSKTDQVLARELMATGWPSWQVLARALRGTRPPCEVLYTGDPFGVAYLVAVLLAAPA
ncbi:MAG TPA: hypothetical protein VFV41_25700 [Streptosporangiaceae bacterium]|nr:hypothetical protein [Streptosporangiaceae bacterium]